MYVFRWKMGNQPIYAAHEIPPNQVICGRIAIRNYFFSKPQIKEKIQS